MAELGLIAARWLHFVATTLLFGLGLFEIYAPRTVRATTHRAWLPILALGSGLAWFAFATVAMAGGWAQAPAMVPMILFETDFGPLWCMRLLTALALCVPAVTRGGRLALSGLLLVSLALTGHAHMHEGTLGWAHAGADAIHLLAAGAWLGAVAGFLGLLSRAPKDAETARSLHAFANIGTLAVAVLLASGLVNAWMVLDTPAALLGSLYGRLLVAKVGLFGAMLALAAVNRFRLVPALTADPTTDAANSLRRHLIAELALGLGVLAIVSIIGTLDPTA